MFSETIIDAKRLVTFNELSKITGIPQQTLRRNLTDVNCVRIGKGKTSPRYMKLGEAMEAIKKCIERL